MTSLDSPVRVAILGSCVSRDMADTFPSDRCEITCYIARHSVVASSTDATAHLPAELGLSSQFQAEGVLSDAGADSIRRRLAAVAPRVDVLLWDLTDERHGFVEFADGSVMTRSVDNMATPALSAVLDQGVSVPFGTDAHFDRWCAAVERVEAVLSELGLRERVLVVAVPWAEVTVEGEPAPPSMGVEPRDANPRFTRYYAHLAALGHPLVTVADPRADPDHKWGLAPFHYERRVYDELRREVEQFVAARRRAVLATAEGQASPRPKATAEQAIRSVTLEVDEGHLVSRIDLAAEASGATFAFYVHRNMQRIHFEDYRPGQVFRFDTHGEPGYYRVTGFVRHADGATAYAQSVPIFLNPVEVTASSWAQRPSDKVAYLMQGEHWSFEALSLPHRNPVLFVLLPSAVRRDQVALPAFTRWTWALEGKYPGHVLCVADPTMRLHDQLQLGWCLGTAEHDATAELAALVRGLARARGIPAEGIVTYGSSAGGFAALALAAHLPGSTAVAINPQTDLLSYEHTGQVNLVREVCFDGAEPEVIRREHGPRVDMALRWAGRDESRAFIVQNDQDPHHRHVHLPPLWQALGGGPVPGAGHEDVGPHHLWVYTHASGHAAETPEMLDEILRRLGLAD